MKYDTTKPNDSSTDTMEHSDFQEEDGTDEGMSSARRLQSVFKEFNFIKGRL